MKARTRIVALLTFIVVLLGLGAGAQANAAPTVPAAPNSSTNGCVVVVPLNVAVCVGRF